MPRGGKVGAFLSRGGGDLRWVFAFLCAFFLASATEDDEAATRIAIRRRLRSDMLEKSGSEYSTGRESNELICP